MNNGSTGVEHSEHAKTRRACSRRNEYVRICIHKNSGEIIYVQELPTLPFPPLDIDRSDEIMVVKTISQRYYYYYVFDLETIFAAKFCLVHCNLSVLQVF